MRYCKQEVIFLLVISLAEDSSNNGRKKSRVWKINERFFLEYEPSYTGSIKLLAVTEQTPRAIYRQRVHENIWGGGAGGVHSLW